MSLTFRIGLPIIAALVICGISSAQSSEPETPSVQSFQKDFIAKFSGKTPIRGDKVLPARSFRSQRTKAADFLVSTLEDLGLPYERQVYRHPNIHPALDLVMPPMRGQNVISHIPATAPSSDYIVLGAHYDSVINSPGADDNASGVAVSLSIASEISELDTRNTHLLVVFFDQEEDESAGSKAFIRKLKRDGLTIRSMHNIDMIGWDGDEDRNFEVDVSTDEMEAIYRSAASKSGVTVSRATYNSADHLPFREAGIEAVCVSEEYTTGDFTPHYHKPSDTLDTLDFDYMESMTTIMVDVIAELLTQ